MMMSFGARVGATLIWEEESGFIPCLQHHITSKTKLIRTNKLILPDITEGQRPSPGGSGCR